MNAFRGWLIPLFLAALALVPTFAFAQESELAATLEVLAEGVEVRRVNTSEWIAVRVEAIVGVGDEIRTDASGSARITFFADGTDTQLLSNTQYRIEQFAGSSESYTIEASVLVGQTTQRLSELLDADSSYDINTPSMQLTARGTAFDIRVEANGRAAMLVDDGAVDASGNAAGAAQVAPGFGIRAAVDEALSDVVAATTFEQLDAGIDGCEAALTTPDDVSLNVRVGASVDYPRVGTIAASEIGRLFGVSEAGDWYRIGYRGGFGWILSSTAVIGEGCAGLRRFPNGFGPEDATRFEVLGDPVTLDELQNVQPVTPEATPETPDASAPEATPEA